MDREQLAHFLRTRREALQPEDVGLPRRPRRRTSGLSRDEVAALAGMSTDYYSRLEQQRGPTPSEQMLAAIAQGLRLSLDERDHLFRLAGHNAPTRVLRSDHVSQGLMRVLDRLTDTPAMVLSGLGETLVQNWLATALLGDQTCFTGLARSSVYRWFTDPSSRSIYPEEDHGHHARVQVAALRAALVRNGPGSRAAAVVDSLLELSPEFSALWEQHEVAVRRGEHKRVQHPELGVLDLHCQVLHADSQDQILLVYTASPGTEGYEKLSLLSALGSQFA
ncbi:helix-turn-helix transcriptional regulator [Allokutzneria sp. A3M-2-11 16]|uniref:helix-turn-helix transcriptional regulator n=1 Tax=Allokutzneria sp. A3M-2-11 16 TaxID=2962043 RepID=UPI0020B882F8|nr:helix-turn-helix transcriptional regulator [Allokutzneria sp. A3M-2-11 16]MCP3803085.1 helix-turn-helix transcriptional regulator [Allokutzneria sp. A3M-2-11 16]